MSFLPYKHELNYKYRNFLIIFFIAVITKVFPVFIATPITADACVYLDMARNFSRGFGLTSLYNFYQFWGPDTLFYPAWPFMHPLFPFLSGIIWFIFHSINAVILTNVFISGINCLILYILVEKIYNSEIALWSALLASICWPMEYTSIFPWSEQLHLFFLLLSVYLLIRKEILTKLNLFLAGIVLGLSYLVRVSSLYNVIIIAIVILGCFGITIKTIRHLSLIFLGFICIALPYQAFCFIKYHSLYPQYPLPAQVFNFSRLSGGYYSSVKPILRLNYHPNKDFLSFFLYNFPRHLISFWQNIFKDLNFLSWVILVSVFSVFRKRRFPEWLFLCLGLLHVLFYSFTFYWLPTAWLECQRYLIISIIFWIPIGVAAIYNVQHVLKDSAQLNYRKFYFIGIMIFLFFLIGQGTWNINFDYIKNRAEIGKIKSIQNYTFSWLKDNSEPGDIIATTEYQYAFNLDRPVVSLPEGRVINEVNIENFLKIFKPKYILILKYYQENYKAFLEKHCLELSTPSVISGSYVVYKLK